MKIKWRLTFLFVLFAEAQNQARRCSSGETCKSCPSLIEDFKNGKITRSFVQSKICGNSRNTFCCPTPSTSDNNVGVGIYTRPGGSLSTTEHPIGATLKFSELANNEEGELTFTDGRKYKGYFVNGEPHGQGTFTWPNGDKFEGEFRNGARNGIGTMYWADNTTYSGNWKDDERNGFGLMVFPDGEWYEGEFEKNKFNGEGEFHYKDGSSYQGQYRDGERNGYGKLIWKRNRDNDEYEGEFKNGIANGYGKMKYKNGNIYQGAWLNGDRHGAGIQQFFDNVIFLGDWQQDVIRGTGLYYWTDTGNCFHGKVNSNQGEQGLMVTADKIITFQPYQDGVQHGRGYRTNLNTQEFYCSRWTRGDIQDEPCNPNANKTTTIFYDNYDRYQGDVKIVFGEEIKHGHGVFTVDGEYGYHYIGRWKNDVIEGFGGLLEKIGTSSVGQFQEGKLHGSGVSYSFSKIHNTSYCGGWFKGQMHGYGLFKYPNSDIVISQFNFGKRIKDRGLYISGADPKNIKTW